MSDSELFWTHVQRALDERRDPREEEAVQALLAAQPELFRELQSMLDGLEHLPRAAPRPRLRRVAALAGASIAAAFAIFWSTHRSDVAPRAQTPLQERVISFEWEVSTQTPTRSTSIVVNDRGLTARAEYRDDPQHHTTWTTESTHPNHP